MLCTRRRKSRPSQRDMRTSHSIPHHSPLSDPILTHTPTQDRPDPLGMVLHHRHRLPLHPQLRRHAPHRRRLDPMRAGAVLPPAVQGPPRRRMARAAGYCLWQRVRVPADSCTSSFLPFIILSHFPPSTLPPSPFLLHFPPFSVVAFQGKLIYVLPAYLLPHRCPPTSIYALQPSYMRLRHDRTRATATVRSPSSASSSSRAASGSQVPAGRISLGECSLLLASPCLWVVEHEPGDWTPVSVCERAVRATMQT